MIFTERKITVRKGKSSIDEPVILYRGDFEVELRFTIMETKYRFKSGVNLVDSEKASYAQLALLAPDGANVFTEVGRCEDGTAIFVLSKEMIDELSEVGLYSFQIRLFDYYRESRITIPPIEFGIEVREPIAAEDHINAVDQAMVGYSIAKTSVLDEPVGPAFDDNGQYNKTDWETGDRISEGRLNKIEDALDQINQNEKNDVAALDKRVTNNFNTLNSTKANKNDIFSMANMGQDVKEAMTGGSVPVVGKDAILTENIVDHQVTPAKIAPQISDRLSISFENFRIGRVTSTGAFSDDDDKSFISEIQYLPKGTRLDLLDAYLFHAVYVYSNYSEESFIERINISQAYYIIPISGYYRIQIVLRGTPPVSMDDLDLALALFNISYDEWFMTKHNVNQLMEPLAEHLPISLNGCVMGVIDTSGNLGTGTKSIVTYRTRLPKNTTIKLDANTTAYIHRIAISDYDTYSVKQVISTSNQPKEYVTPEDALYRFQVALSGTPDISENDRDAIYNSMNVNIPNPIMKYDDTYRMINDAVAPLESVKMYFPISPFEGYIQGTIRDDSGVISSGQESIVTNMIWLEKDSTVYISGYACYMHRIGLYDDASKCKGTTSVHRKEYLIPEDGYYRFQIVLDSVANIDGNVEVQDAMYNSVKVNKSNEFLTIEKYRELESNNSLSSDNIIFLNKISSVMYQGCSIHMSFDDTWKCFHDLQTTRPSSIYDIKMFNDMKILHETYGAKFTLFCFLIDASTGFRLENTPSTWASEFQAAKDWLKFGFHALDTNTRYSTALTGKQDYETFVRAIYNMTNDYECIDTVVRLGFFAGTKQQVLDMRDCEHGITGLLSADDTRLPYYFNQDITDFIIKHGKYFEADTQLIHVRTIPRLDSYTGENVIAFLESNPSHQKHIEIFSHNLSSSDFSRMETIFKWANEKGYKHEFLMHIYDL